MSPSSVSAWLGALHLVDYFPSANAWDNMWTNFDPSAIAADFARIKAMNGNAVRIIPRVPAFGYPEPTAAMLQELRQTISLAQQNGLRVELTLFDGFTDYSDVSGSETWAAAVLGPYAGSSEIAYVDLQNEIDLAPAGAVPWAQQLLPYVRGLLGGIPVTASVTISSGTGDLQDVLAGLGSVRPDLYDVHFYGQEGLAYARLLAVKKLVSPAPVVLGETGYSTTVTDSSVAGLPQTQASQEAYQAYYLNSVDYAAALLGIPAAPWILNDFTPTAWPGASADQYGLYRVDGTPKPSVQTESDYFSGQPLATDFNQGFEQTTLVNGQLEPLLWREYQPSDVTASFAADTSVAHTGTTSARISGTSGGTWGCASFYLVPVSALTPGQTYTASVYARGAGATGSSYLSLSWFDQNGVFLSETDSPDLPSGTSSWQQLTASGQPPANAAFVQLHLKSCNNQGSVWFDDAQFGPVASVSAPTTPTTAPSSPPAGPAAPAASTSAGASASASTGASDSSAPPGPASRPRKHAKRHHAKLRRRRPSRKHRRSATGRHPR